MIGSFPSLIKIVCVRSGFALGPEGAFFRSARPLRIEIEGMRLLSPAQIKALLQKGKCAENVKMLVEEDESPSYVYRGNIQIENAHYRLVKVDFRCSDSEKILKAKLADISEVDKGFLYTCAKEEVIGEIETKESGGTAKGHLDINQGMFIGRYTVYLDAPLEG